MSSLARRVRHRSCSVTHESRMRQMLFLVKDAAAQITSNSASRAYRMDQLLERGRHACDLSGSVCAHAGRHNIVQDPYHRITSLIFRTITSHNASFDGPSCCRRKTFSQYHCRPLNTGFARSLRHWPLPTIASDTRSPSNW